MKIAYIYSTMATKGGTERMITEKANYFSEHFGYDVTIIICFDVQTVPTVATGIPFTLAPVPL